MSRRSFINLHPPGGITRMEYSTRMERPLVQLVAHLTRRYPLCSGCGTLANTALLRRLTPGDEELWAPIRRGGRMRIRPNDWVGRSIYFFGDLDPKVSWVLRRLVRPGDAVLDVGANQGLVTVMAAHLVGPTGTVHAFEPQLNLAALIRRTVAELDLGHVHVHSLALSDQPGPQRLTIPGGNAGAAHFGEAAPGEGPSVQVQTARLDDLLHGNARPRLMKLDVEGHEEQVLLGARAFLDRSPPDVILFESHDPRPVFLRPAANVLAEHDYVLADLPPSLVQPRARWVGDDGVARGHDLLAVHRECDPDSASRIGLAPNRRVRVAIPEPVAATMA